MNGAADGAGPADGNDAQARRAIAEGSADAKEQQDSQVLYDALRRHRDTLAGAAKVSFQDPALSERILSEARNRSAEIRAAQRPPGARPGLHGRPLPKWLLLAWVVAIVAFLAAWYLLGR